MSILIGYNRRQVMLCKDCKHFKIEYEPYKSGGVCWDTGLARCEKHDLVTDFITHKKFESLECVEEPHEQETRLSPL